MDTKSAGMQGEASKEKLMQDLRAVLADAEELLQATANQAGEHASSVRGRIQESLAAAKAGLAAEELMVVEKAKEAAKVADEYVHENPWESVAIAAGVGLIIGMLISRRR